MVSFDAQISAIVDQVTCECTIWFDYQTLKKHKLFYGSFVYLKHSNYATWARIDVEHSNTTSNACRISLLLSKNLHVQVGQPVTVVLPCKNKKESVVCNEVVLEYLNQEETKYTRELIHQAFDMITIEERFCNVGAIIGVHVCEKYFEFRVVGAEADASELIRISHDTKLKLEDKKFNTVTDAVEWEKKVLKEIPGYTNLVKDIIQLICISQISHFQRTNPLHKFTTVHGFLLYGESGTGKSKLVNSIIKHSGWECIRVNTNEIFDEYVGSAEKKIANIFKNAMQKKGSLFILIDNVDVIAADKSSVRSRLEKQVLGELIYWFEKIGKCKDLFIMVIGVTNRVDIIDPAFRRVGRFEREFEMKVPSIESREAILKYLLRDVPLGNQIETILKELCEKTHGFVFADLVKLVQESALNAMRRKSTVVNNIDFLDALKTVQPSLLSSRNQKFQPVRLSELAGIDDIKQKLKISVIYPLQYKDKYIELGVPPPRGILLHGPPGVGKTLLAQAIANEANANFVSVQCTEIISKVVGASSRAISALFKQARASSPCVLFFDQFEAIARARGTDWSESQSADRMLSTLLTEMDGIASNAKSHVIVLAATNRIDLLDAAILRPGRLDQQIYIPLPNKDARLAILKHKCEKMPISKEVSLEKLADETEGCSSADLVNMCREAAMNCLRENINNTEILMKHFEAAKKIIIKEKL